MPNMKNPNRLFSSFLYCPKCGKPELVQDSEKSIRCAACGFRYFINMNAAVAAVIRNDKNEILFTVRKHEPAAGMLDLPGGFVDMGETAENAVRREILEELNLEISSLEYWGSYTNRYLYAEVEYQTLDLVFLCSVKTFDSIKAADDVSGYVFKNPKSVKPHEIGLESIKAIINSILENFSVANGE
jgi:mutator protein MutT